MRLRTANRRKDRARGERVRWNRHRRSLPVKRWIATTAKRMAVVLGCPDRPWFRLRMKP